MTETLSKAVTSLQEKAERYQQEKEAEQQIKDIKGKLDEYNQEIANLIPIIVEMEFYMRVLTDIFDEHPPEQSEATLQDIQDLQNHSKRDIVNAAVNQELEEFLDRAENIQTDAENALSQIKTRIERKKQIWRERADTAELIQSITGESNTSRSTTEEINQFVTHEIWDQSNDVEVLITEWERLMDRWNEYKLQSFDELQERFELSNETVDIIERLNEGEDVFLAEVSPTVVEELKRIPGLNSTIKFVL